MPATSEVTNQDVLLYALYRLEGSGRFVDVEDIYIECWRLSPSRFAWRSDKSRVSDKVGHQSFVDLERLHPELLLKTPNGLSRQLSSEGVLWVRERLTALQALSQGQTKAPAHRRASHKLVTELAGNATVKAFLSGDRSEPAKVQLAELMGCAPDSPRSIWESRLATLRSAAEDDERPELVAFLDHAGKTLSTFESWRR